MKTKFFSLPVIAVFLCSLLQVWSTPARADDADKPILLMGTGYSRHERKALIKDVLEPNKLAFEDGGDFKSAEKWKDYSLVIVTHGFPALDEKELGWIHDYLNGGGKLILSGPVLSSLQSLKGAQRDWLGAGTYRVIRAGDYTVAEEGKALVPDVETAGAIFSRAGDYGLAKLTTAKALVSRDGAPVLARNAFGKGEVWFVGLEYFRILASEPVVAERAKAGKPAHDLLEKLILQSRAPKN